MVSALSTDNEATSNYDTAENANLFSFSNRTNEQTKPNTDPSRTVFPNNKTPNDNYSDKNRTTQQTLAEIPNDDTRQISSIIVLYTDGSFETFRPQNS